MEIVFKDDYGKQKLAIGAIANEFIGNNFTNDSMMQLEDNVIQLASLTLSIVESLYKKGLLDKKEVFLLLSKQLNLGDFDDFEIIIN